MTPGAPASRVLHKVLALPRLFGRSVRQEGIPASLECLVRVLGTKTLGMSAVGHPRINVMIYKITDCLYDWIHGVDTCGIPDRPEMKFGRGYVATPTRAWNLMHRRLPIDPSRFTYLDFGCGKGRTLICASTAGFRRVIGVEVSPELAAIARHNLAAKGIAAEVVTGDVRTFDFPEEPLVLFMYNPFFGDIMSEIVDRLEQSLASCPREIYIIYYSASLKEIWEKSLFSEVFSSDLPYPNYAIYGPRPAF